MLQGPIVSIALERASGWDSVRTVALVASSLFSLGGAVAAWTAVAVNGRSQQRNRKQSTIVFRHQYYSVIVSDVVRASLDAIGEDTRNLTSASLARYAQHVTAGSQQGTEEEGQRAFDAFNASYYPLSLTLHEVASAWRDEQLKARLQGEARKFQDDYTTLLDDLHVQLNKGKISVDAATQRLQEVVSVYRAHSIRIVMEHDPGFELVKS